MTPYTKKFVFVIKNKLFKIKLCELYKDSHIYAIRYGRTKPFSSTNVFDSRQLKTAKYLGINKFKVCSQDFSPNNSCSER